MDVQKIKELALANGFSLKEQASGNMDLHSYVYEFANAIEQAVKAQAVPEGISVKDKLPPPNILVLGMSQTRSNIFNTYTVMDLDEFEEIGRKAVRVIVYKGKNFCRYKNGRWRN